MEEVILIERIKHLEDLHEVRLWENTEPQYVPRLRGAGKGPSHLHAMRAALAIMITIIDQEIILFDLRQSSVSTK